MDCTAAASAQKVITKNGWTRTELLDVSSLINEANNVNRDERDACVKFVSSNNGYSFKAAQPEDSNAVCLNQCDDGRDCYTVVGGCDEGCQYCVRVSQTRCLFVFRSCLAVLS